jgi:mRNA deadenylase 3'-5' endonuclease subunit Ccr4
MKIGLASRKLLSISSFIAYRGFSTSSSIAMSMSMSMSTTNMQSNTMSSSSTQTKPLNIHITSYNVLSSHLSEPDHYSTLNPDHLDPINRLPIVLNKLEDEIENQNASIICLQEVSHDWAGSFHTYFANKGYHMVTGLYGKHFNGYMGVAIAFKLSDYNVLDVDISRLADKREDGWPRKPREKSSFIKNIYKGIYTSLSSTIKSLYYTVLGTTPKRIIDPWFMSQNRFNQLVTVKLQDKKTKKSFAIGNYHMPCAFYAPHVMTIHTDLAARHVQRLASGAMDNNSNDENDNDETSTAATATTTSSMPYILAGDWNIKPGDASYNLLTTGMMDKGKSFFDRSID